MSDLPSTQLVPVHFSLSDSGQGRFSNSYRGGLPSSDWLEGHRSQDFAPASPPPPTVTQMGAMEEFASEDVGQRGSFGATSGSKIFENPGQLRSRGTGFPCSGTTDTAGLTVRRHQVSGAGAGSSRCSADGRGDGGRHRGGRGRQHPEGRPPGPELGPFGWQPAFFCADSVFFTPYF